MVVFSGGFFFRSLGLSYDSSGFSLITANAIYHIPLDMRFFSRFYSFFTISYAQLVSTIARFRILYLGLYGGHFCVLHAKGIGFKVYLSTLRHALYFFLGYNHITKYILPANVSAKPLKGHILFHTARRDSFGASVFYTRHLRFPDPYRGKGIRYRYQVIKFKPGKQRLNCILNFYMLVTNFIARFIEESTCLGPFLTNYYGIGQRRSRMLCRSVGVAYGKRIRAIPASTLKHLEHAIARTVPKDFLLRRQVNANLSFKYSNNSLAGQRLYQGLPSRRQRTKTNARTARRMKIDFSKIILFVWFPHRVFCSSLFASPPAILPAVISLTNLFPLVPPLMTDAALIFIVDPPLLSRLRPLVFFLDFLPDFHILSVVRPLHADSDLFADAVIRFVLLPF